MSTDAGTWQTTERSKSQQAKDEGKDVAGHVKDEAGSVADKVRDEAGAVAQVAEEQARGLLHDAQEQVRQQGEQQVTRLSEALQSLSKNLQALQEGRTEEAGPLADYLERARRQVDDNARRVEELGLSGVLDETRRFARRRPGAFLSGAAVAGLVVGRIARAGKDARSSDGGGGATAELPAGPVGRTAGTATPIPPPAPIADEPVEPVSPVDPVVDGPDVVVVTDEGTEPGAPGTGSTR